MIPTKLELTNFLSYRETVLLEFDGLRLACISGLNGAGKSSILDSMTWALFGKSRSRSDDDLVNRLAALKNSHAEVRFCFELEGACYRVIRRKKVGGPAELEFQIQDGPERWQALTEGRLRETQAAIEQLLRMNFDTFVNASFFLQGKADEFTTKTAGKRKEILAELLGVNRWDVYKEAAANRRKEEERKLVLLDGRVQDIVTELQEESERAAALAQARTEHEAIKKQLDSQEALLRQLRQIAEAIKQQQARVQEVKQTLLRQRATLERLCQRRTERQKEREALQATLDDAAGIVAAYEAYRTAEERFQSWQELQGQYHRLQQQRRPHELKLEGERNRLQQLVRTLEARAAQVQQMQTEQETVSAQLQTAQAERGSLQQRLEKLAEQEQAWHEARSALQTAESERRLLAQQLQEWQKRAQGIGRLREERASVEKNWEEAQLALSEAEEKLLLLAEQRQRHPVALADRDRLQQEQVALKAAGEKLGERLSRLEDQTGGECPVCGQPLSEEHRQEVVAELSQEREEKRQQYRSNQEQLAALAEEIEALDQALKQAHRPEQEQRAQQQRQATARARLEEIDRALNEWEEEGPGRIATLEAQLADGGPLKGLRAEVEKLGQGMQEKGALEEARQRAEQTAARAAARLAEIERAIQEWEATGRCDLEKAQQKLANNEIDAEAQAALAELDKATAALGYDAAAHQEVRAARDELAEAPGRYQQLQQAQAAIKPLDDNLADLEEQSATQEEEVAALMQQQEEAQAQLETLQAGGGDLEAVEREVIGLREEEIAANRKIGAARQRLDVLDDLRAERDQLHEERAAQTLLIQRLERLEAACGRNGIQALLIEQAIPEIERDANELLERLSGGSMHLAIPTQRQMKTRDALMETLDIQISDAAGERPYENFSGGEQFRVNFAIRLALSKILARRAGARLQTLVIDEGFGSQDPAGRQRLVEAINTIQDDFERILVITHIDELRDAFPRRIEVEKGPAGSMITVF